jgi:hypothetical protein
MAKVVSYDNPAFEKGVEVDLGGILVPNGGSVDITPELEDALVSKNGTNLRDHFKGNAHVKYSGKSEGGDS